MALPTGIPRGEVLFNGVHYDAVYFAGGTVLKFTTPDVTLTGSAPDETTTVPFTFSGQLNAFSDLEFRTPTYLRRRLWGRARRGRIHRPAVPPVRHNHSSRERFRSPITTFHQFLSQARCRSTARERVFGARRQTIPSSSRLDSVPAVRRTSPSRGRRALVSDPPNPPENHLDSTVQERRSKDIAALIDVMGRRPLVLGPKDRHYVRF